SSTRPQARRRGNTQQARRCGLFQQARYRGRMLQAAESPAQPPKPTAEKSQPSASNERV
ncbi:hypothetical protein IWW50_004973, partial [Coemansia erecta]